MVLWSNNVLLGNASPVLAHGIVSEVWSDDFNDGNYVNWNVTWGNFSVTDGILSGIGRGPNLIHRNSTAANGTWSFDLYYDGTYQVALWFVCNYLNPSYYYNPEDGYRLLIEDDRIRIQVEHSDSRETLHSYNFGNLTGWWNFTVTREPTGRIDVFVDGVLRSTTSDNTFKTSSYFCFLTQGPHAIDNVRVLDTVEPPEFTFIRTTDATTTTIETSQTSSADPTSPPINPSDIIEYLIGDLGVSIAMGIAVFALLTASILRYSRLRNA